MDNSSFLGRRQLLKNIAGTVVTLQLAPILTKTTHAETSCASDVRILSGPSAYAPLPGHLHYLTIPFEALNAPPVSGIKLNTTLAYLHFHQVALSQEQLIGIAQGLTVIVEDTVKDHHYTIRLISQNC